MGLVVPIHHQKPVPEATGRPDSSPVDVYLGRLAPGSRRGIVVALNTIAGQLSNGSADAFNFDWASLRYDQTSAVRQHLAKTYSIHTANLAISALRGVLKDCWRLGLIPHDAYTRAIDLPRVKGEMEVAGRSLTVDELRALSKVCEADPSPAGIRDAAMLALLYCTGIRRHEIVALTVADYDHKEGIFNRYHIVPPARLRTTMQTLASKRAENLKTADNSYIVHTESAKAPQTTDKTKVAVTVH